MDITWLDRLSLFRWALCAAVLAGVVCPLIGALLYVRRTSFYGIALPQFAAAGVVLGFVCLPWWIEHVGIGELTLDDALGDSHAAINYHLAWAGAATFGGLVALLALGRRGGGAGEIGRVAAAFALANAATYLFGRISPIGRSFVDELLSGEILGIGPHELEVLGAAYGLVLVAVVALRQDLVLVSFDREFATVIGRNVLAVEGLLTVLTGVTIAVGTIALGPTLLFGLLVVPPLAARAWARSMKGFLALAPAFGLASVVAGVVASFELDLPLGAAIVGTSGLVALPGVVVTRWRRRRAA